MEKFTVALVSCSFTMTAVSLIYSLLSRLLKNVQSSKWRYYTWILIFFGFILLFKPSFGEPAFTVETEGGSVNGLAVGDLGVIPFYGHFCDVIFEIWTAGFLFKLGYILIKQHLFIKSIKRLSRPVSKEISDLARKTADKLGTAVNFKVVTVSGISSPMVTGLWKSLLILPEREFAESELYLILKHEIVHLKRHDLFIKMFMLFCGAIHWFNPFMKRLIRSAEQEGELYCDETVMANENGKLKKLYCQSILNTVSAEGKRTNALIPAVASNFSFNKQGLKHRMKMILSFDKKYRLGIIGVLILALTLFTGTVTAFSDIQNYDGDSVETTTVGAAASYIEVKTSDVTEISQAYKPLPEGSNAAAEITDAPVTFAFTTRIVE